MAHIARYRHTNESARGPSIAGFGELIGCDLPFTPTLRWLDTVKTLKPWEPDQRFNGFVAGKAFVRL